MPAPTILPPLPPISGKPAIWFGVKGAVEEALHSMHPISPVSGSRVKRSKRVRTPLWVSIVIWRPTVKPLCSTSASTAFSNAAPAARLTQGFQLSNPRWVSALCRTAKDIFSGHGGSGSAARNATSSSSFRASFCTIGWTFTRSLIVLS